MHSVWRSVVLSEGGSRFRSLSALHNNHRWNLCKKTQFVSVVSVIIITPWLSLHQMSWMEPFCLIYLKTCPLLFFKTFHQHGGIRHSTDWSLLFEVNLSYAEWGVCCFILHEFHFFFSFFFKSRSGKIALAIVVITGPWLQCTAWQHLEHDVNSPHNTGWIHSTKTTVSCHDAGCARPNTWWNVQIQCLSFGLGLGWTGLANVSHTIFSCPVLL